MRPALLRPAPWLAALATLALSAAAFATEAPESPVEGTWELGRAGLIGKRLMIQKVRLVVREGVVTGKSEDGWTYTGHAAAERGIWVLSLFGEGPNKRGDSGHLAFAGQLAGDVITGTVVGQQGYSGPFSMKRVAEGPQDADAEVLAAWRALPSSSNSCQGFDYFPNGGLRAFFCHAQSVMPFEKLARLAGTRVFVSGPHRAGQVNFNSESEFGHYDLGFVKWLGQHGIPGQGDPILKAALQPIYDRDMKSLARVYLAVALRLWSDPDYFSTQARAYTNYRNHRPDFARFAGLDENLWVPAHAFWVRRKLDGTADAFLDVLRTLMNTYDPGAASAVAPPPRTDRPPMIVDPVRPKLQLPNQPMGKPAPTCRDVLVEMGHHASYIGRCKGVDNACAVALLKAGHNPSLLSRCKPGLAPQCAVTLLAKGHHPSLLSRCRGVDDDCAVKLLERGDHPAQLSHCKK